jgi:hypothetical protein
MDEGDETWAKNQKRDTSHQSSLMTNDFSMAVEVGPECAHAKRAVNE